MHLCTIKPVLDRPPFPSLSLSCSAPPSVLQAVWALARLRRTDKPTLDALVKATKGKLGALESPVDAAALAWSLGFLSKCRREVVGALGGGGMNEMAC